MKNWIFRIELFITPHSPDDGSGEPKRYSVNFSINLSFHLDYLVINFSTHTHTHIYIYIYIYIYISINFFFMLKNLLTKVSFSHRGEHTHMHTYIHTHFFLSLLLAIYIYIYISGHEYSPRQTFPMSMFLAFNQTKNILNLSFFFFLFPSSGNKFYFLFFQFLHLYIPSPSFLPPLTTNDKFFNIFRNSLLTMQKSQWTFFFLPFLF